MKISSILYPALVFIALLSVTACDDEDKIAPRPPVVSASPADSILITNEHPEKDSVITATANYQYGKFRDMPFRILFPKNYDAHKSYPLLVFLHGLNERGFDNEQQLKWGASLFKRDSIRDAYPAFVIFPQCSPDHRWLDQSETEMLKALIDAATEKYKIDKSSIFIAGLSMGASGTYAMVAKYPGLFAAAVAISGDGDASKATVMSRTKWRIFAGKKDNVVSSDMSAKMAMALKKSGASVSFTLYPEADHTGSWLKAFAEPDFCSWFFSTND